MNPTQLQDLSQFKLPKDFRGRPGWQVQLWWIVLSIVFRNSPEFAYGFRRQLLRFFGARIGEGVRIRNTATVTYPWKVTIGAHSWIGHEVVLYSLGEITIGDNTAIAHRCYLCAADHDYTKRDFPIRTRPINIGSQAWLGNDCFIGPGVDIGLGTVVGARSSVFHNLPPAMVCVGSPCKPIKPRISTDPEAYSGPPVSG